jgi:hypothetical protein
MLCPVHSTPITHGQHTACGRRPSPKAGHGAHRRRPPCILASTCSGGRAGAAATAPALAGPPGFEDRLALGRLDLLAEAVAV